MQMTNGPLDVRQWFTCNLSEITLLSFIRGAFGKFLAWHHNSTIIGKMLSNNAFLETRIQRLLNGLNFVKKDSACTCSACSK